MLAIFLASGLAAASPNLKHLTSQYVALEVKSHGAKRVVDRLLQSGQWWSLTKYIAEGRPEWIALAPVLSPGADAGTAESLRSSLAYALPKSPLATLQVLNTDDKSPTTSIKEVCSLPLYDQTQAELRQYKRTTLAVLKRVDSLGLRATAAACAAEIQNGG